MSLKDIRIGFELDASMQNDAYSFLKKIDHKRGAFISYLVTEFLLNNYIGDFTQMTKEEAKIFATYILGEYAEDNDTSEHANKINAMLNVLSRTPSSGLTHSVKTQTNNTTEPMTYQSSNSHSYSSDVDSKEIRTDATVVPVSTSSAENTINASLSSYNNDDELKINNLEVEDDFDVDDDLDDEENSIQMNETAFKAMMNLF